MTDVELANVSFDKKDWHRCNEWRRYVPTEYLEQWKFLTSRERRIVYVMADNQASQEEWD